MEVNMIVKSRIEELLLLIVIRGYDKIQKVKRRCNLILFIRNRIVKNFLIEIFQLGCFFCFIAFSLLVLPTISFAASTPTNQLLKQIGSGAPTSYGDYISSSGGLNTYYSYFIEVPPGTGRLDIRIYDADVGLGSANDWTNDSFNTSCNYTIYDPNGNTVTQDFYTGNNSGPPGSNNSWRRLFRRNNPTAGHWELRVDMSSSVTSGNDMNGYGIRANDPVNGMELNIYAESFAPLGALGSGTTQTTTLYPFITSGCTADWNDWDGDNGGSTLCTVAYTSRTSNFSSSYNGSGGTVWLNTPLSGFTTDDSSFDYGVWSTSVSYTDTGAGGNFGVLYIGNYNASNPPPTNQPETDTFRIYFRTTNTNGAPPKPVLTQNLRHISGPNPPTSGSTTRVRVAVSIYNPTPHSITFSASNLITANVPGAGAVYAGNASVTQGTITAQPSIGGTGNITWNPGSVSGSNNSETLSYEVDVTPTLSGQRIPVTGQPGSNGTTAAYVDETGNTTQSRATYTYGPLCELAVTESGGPIPTMAFISSFKAYEESGHVVVHWETASEINTSGFYLFRKDASNGRFHQVNKTFLPGLLHSPRGGVYRLVDNTASYGETYTYRLIEVESNGRKRLHGLFTVTIGGGVDADTQVKESMSGTYNKKNHPISFAKKARLQARKLALKSIITHKKSEVRGKAKFAVKEKGLYFLSTSQIADVLGMPFQHIQSMISYHKLQLQNQGKQVAWLSAEGNSGIYFYGEGIESIYTNENIYWLETGNGLDMGFVYGGMPPSAAGNETFTDTIHVEEDHYALTALFKKRGDDYWLWDYITGGQGGKTFAFHLHGAAADGTASLTVHLKGASDTNSNPDHHVKVALNGSQLGESQWDGTETHTFTIPFDQSLLKDGDNTIQVSGILDSGVPYSIFYVDSFDVSYNRYYRAVNNCLLCRGDGNPVITIEGFTNPAVMVFEVTDPLQPKLVTGTTIDMTNRVSFIPSSPENLYLALGVNGLYSPVSVTADKPSNLRHIQNSADYVVIVPEELEEAVQNLVYLRQRKGLETMVVKLEDIYDEFNHGIPDPEAIKEFLKYAYRKWKGNVPQYAVLVGDGTYDYKDNLGYSENLVPPILVSTPYGLFASDNLYGDVKGNDGVPEIAIGRLPVMTEEELQVLIDKIYDYEDARGEWTGRVILLADDADSGGDFPADSNYLAKLVPGYTFTVDKIYLSDFPTVNEARQEVLNGFNTGALLVNYIGHAGITRLASEGLLRSEDVSFFQNGEKLPILTAMTCVVGRFTLPGYDTLSEELLLKNNGGVVAVWAPTGASLNDSAVMLAEAFFKALFQHQERILGKALLKAMKDYSAAGGQPFTLNMFNLLGDPALEIK
jgi:hypothetical protein